MDPSVTSPAEEHLGALRGLFAQALSPPQRRVLLLYYAENLSFADIAEVLGLSVAAVTRLYREGVAVLEQALH